MNKKLSKFIGTKVSVLPKFMYTYNVYPSRDTQEADLMKIGSFGVKSELGKVNHKRRIKRLLKAELQRNPVKTLEDKQYVAMQIMLYYSNNLFNMIANSKNTMETVVDDINQQVKEENEAAKSVDIETSTAD